MLLQLTLENVYSFRDETVFSLLAAPRLQRDPRSVVRTPVGDVLRIAGIYGPNASGKSNLVRAFAWISRLVTHGTEVDAPIRRHPFALDDKSRRAPSRAELLFLLEGVVWTYGFVVSDEVVESEWLLQADRPVFERDGAAFSGALMEQDRARLVAENTRPEQLFLTNAVDQRLSDVKDVYQAIEHTIPFRGSSLPKPRAVWNIAATGNLAAIADLLRELDTGVTGVRVETSSAALNRHLSGEAPLSYLQAVREAEAARHLELRFRHGDSGQELGWGAESDGTRRLVYLALAWTALESDGLTVVDELDLSLHTHLSLELLARFLESPGRRQLIFTTHDTHLLARDVLPADAVWFVEKSTDGASSLYSLAEFKGEHLEALTGRLDEGYLQGRFGAIPFLADRKRLAWSAS
ncbi:MAG: ATP-binding protein [Alphaproteobacteria bacterium]|nr:ATP-binding protein [Alphaproteobacteria bacterium]MCB9693610.1 ATP-binding protein [Alphaproteobacteria bacterium]